MGYFLVDYIPPILIKILRSAVMRLKLRHTNIDSYEQLELVELIIHKNLQLRQSMSLTDLDAMSFRTIAAVGLAAGNKSDFTVLDFGGGAGHHQLLARNLFKKINFDWTVIETTAMSRLAQKEIVDQGLSFRSSLEALSESNNYDLIFSNSAIQYTSDPLNTLRELLKLQFEHFFITRVPLNVGNGQIKYQQESLLSQNGPGPAPKEMQKKWVKYENNIVSKDSFESILNSALTIWFSVDEGYWDPIRFGDQVKTYSYFGAAKNSTYLG